MSSNRSLIVFDDDEEIRQLISLLAAKEGFEVETAAELKEFKEKVDKMKPDVIIQDLSLSDCDGIEVLRYLGSIGCKSAIALISSFDERLLKSAMNLGSDFGLEVIGNIRKPITGAGLREVLANVPHTTKAVRESDLNNAINTDRLFLTFQPKVDMNTKAVTSAEALVRWQEPDRGLIFPDEFITLAEQSGLIEPMTYQVLDLAVKEAASWKDKGFDIAVAVNLSAASLIDLDFPMKVAQTLEKYGLPANQLILEVTETSAMIDAQKTLDILTRLRIKGISVSIDDFGTGYSSLVELHRMPFSELKIDRSFVMDAHKDKDSRIIINAILGLAKALGLKVVAEGVETQEHWDFLKDAGCDIAQGYLMGKPMVSADFTAWVQDWKSKL
ncbi:putative diguanylate phosphodiesterase (EAL domain) with Response Regulator Receiver modulation [Candidatus Terasakiella magnetica]|uniref:Putative diguanylate phosphodiesterase (EAL domain) with Response Regulator Receiver modulation n=1 Tax=Candidatus Terasakiella magnetica TaxID=1867952 RepID=A0A1C3RK32_9PROT|nr:EAL domain-containing response regulator [Candidatus Terasakiella magnetica]SCA57583.1 putative diguanylate phosphodiesterase (EAL domain) with Response Regulator Receiver modulation [Candidatus Terasakiella magnetica]